MDTATRSAEAPTATRLGRRALAGAVGGIAGGLAFGALMAMMGMLPMIASLVGSTSAAVGFGIHMVISVGIGIGLGLTVLFAQLLSSYPRGLLIGLVYGAIWWVLGPLLLMPLMMGMAPFMFDAGSLPSLVGHLIYGGILGVVAVRLLRQRR
ncbi:hypothetical protein [Agrococcus sp. ProA11]|uniref:hypothetical protein n=1 Tax=Agrococcus chionoecetis TaxID=3153752 RepID=UPI0032616FC7